MIKALPPGGETDWLEAPDGVRLRAMRWRNGKAARTLLIVPGRTEFIEKYCEVIAECLARGFAVGILDMRNHGHSTRPLANRQKHHLEDFALMADDLALMADHLARHDFPTPLALLGHSMGGHVALRFAHDHPGAVGRMVLTAPMIAIRLGSAAPVARGLIGLMPKIGKAQAYALGQGDWKGGRARAVLQLLLTSDRARFDRETAFLEADPDLKLGGVTWGWLAAALRSSRLMMEPGYAETIATTTLFVLAGADRVVEGDAARAFAGRMMKAPVVTIEGARHEILMERDALRTPFWTVFDRFMLAKPASD